MNDFVRTEQEIKGMEQWAEENRTKNIDNDISFGFYDGILSCLQWLRGEMDSSPELKARIQK